MSFLLGMVAGSLVTFVVFVAYMAPKHWEWYHQNIDLRSQLRVAVERAAHYQNLVRPNEWGPVAQHEARIVPNEVRPWDNFEDLKKATLQDHKHEDDIEYRFDDIRDGGD